MMTASELREFEQDIASLFEQGKIPSPVHLSGGNEDELIRIFQNIKSSDWVFSNHRSHYHALLKGIPPEWLKAEILANRSITINCAKYKFFSSAIVGGICPIALGVAMTGQTVWCFVGDMAGMSGIFYECVQYAEGHDLPIKFYCEDNGFSVETPTQKVWGEWRINKPQPKTWRYSYQRTFPHQGVGRFILF